MSSENKPAAFWDPHQLTEQACQTVIASELLSHDNVPNDKEERIASPRKIGNTLLISPSSHKETPHLVITVDTLTSPTKNNVPNKDLT